MDQEPQQRLVELVTTVTQGSVDKAPGFLGASLRRRLDGMKVAMCPSWASAQHHLALRQELGLPTFSPYTDLAEPGHILRDRLGDAVSVLDVQPNDHNIGQGGEGGSMVATTCQPWAAKHRAVASPKPV